MVNVAMSRPTFITEFRHANLNSRSKYGKRKNLKSGRNRNISLTTSSPTWKCVRTVQPVERAVGIAILISTNC